ncbi:O-antigen ligase family protein [Streptomyces sp. NPDC093982]|uniref:O-antigen ligase family protein n=1 Tax=Streptomyces sp. NPDC093982 TaxID=3155077 RepID=UPI00342B7F5D
MITERATAKSPFTAVIGHVGLLAAGPVVTYLTLFHTAATAAVAVAACFVIVVWRRPDMALLMLLGLIPGVAAVHPSGSMLYVIVFGAVGLLIFRVTMIRLRVGLGLILVLLMACAVTLNCLLSRSFSPEHQWKGCALLLAGLGLLAASIVEPPNPRRIAQVMGGAGTGIAGYLLMRGEYVSDRLTGLGLNPNYVGAFMALSVVATVGMARFHRPWVWLLPAAVCAFALLETRSRAAFLMAAAGLACLLLVGRPLRYTVLAGLTIFVSAEALPETVDSVGDGLTGSRTSTELTMNTEVRKRAAALAMRIALDHPVHGIGYDMFPEYARASPTLGVYINTHNDYLRLAAETGIVTLALLAALLWLGLARRYTDSYSVLQALCVSFAVGLLFANTLTSFVVSASFWISLGCLLAHSLHQRTDRFLLSFHNVRKLECSTVKPKSIRASVLPLAAIGSDSGNSSTKNASHSHESRWSRFSEPPT